MRVLFSALIVAALVAVPFALPSLAQTERETVSYECANGTRVTFTGDAATEAFDAATDAACDVLDAPPVITVMTCFDDNGAVTTGDDWKECLPVVIPRF